MLFDIASSLKLCALFYSEIRPILKAAGGHVRIGHIWESCQNYT